MFSALRRFQELRKRIKNIPGYHANTSSGALTQSVIHLKDITVRVQYIYIIFSNALKRDFLAVLAPRTTRASATRIREKHQHDLDRRHTPHMRRVPHVYVSSLSFIYIYIAAAH